MPMALSACSVGGPRSAWALSSSAGPGRPQPDRSIAEFITRSLRRGGRRLSRRTAALRRLRRRPAQSQRPQRAAPLRRPGQSLRQPHPRSARQPPQTSGGRCFDLERRPWRVVDAIVAIFGRQTPSCDRPPRKQSSLPDGFRITAGGDWLEAGNVVDYACEAAQRRRSCSMGRLAELLGRIAYSSSVVVALAYDGAPPMPGFGFLIPRKERRQIVACTWVETKFPRPRAAGKNSRALLSWRRRRAGSSRHPPGIARSHRPSRAEPRFHRVFRWPRAMAQYGVGHAQRVAEIKR